MREGQVGQESNLQPAVLEPAAVRTGTFTEVHEGLKIAHFDRSKYVEVRQSSPALGSKLGSERNHGVTRLHMRTVKDIDEVPRSISRRKSR
jgi:hypothetical protein